MKKTTSYIGIIILICVIISTVGFFSAGSTLSAAPTFEQQLAAFPASYHASLTKIHDQHPNWIFEAVSVQDSWSTVISKETEKEDTNLIPNTSNRAWIRSFKVYDGGGWVPASKLIIEYYMDPRNFLNEKDVFQFEKLSYDSDSQNENGVRAIFADNQGLLAMSPFVMKAAEQSNASAYFLASRMKQEISESSSYGIVNSARGDISVSCPPLTPGAISPCFMTPAEQLAALLALPSLTPQQQSWLDGLRATPQVPIPTPTVRYYNVYNIGATPNPSVIDGARINAITYAMSTNASFLLPWDTQEKAVIGGAKFISANYIAKGQDTMYFQKFAVSGDPSILYIHQYMQNVQAANSEAQRYYSAYSNANMLSQPFVFRIPVYTGMPDQLSAMPSVVKSQTQSTALPGSIGEELMISGSSTYNIRSSPNTTSAVIGKAVQNSYFFIDDLVIGETTSYGNLWYRVNYNGQTGYFVVDLNGQIVPAEVSFNSMGGSPVPSVNVNHQGYLKKPADPTRSGYIFVGWYQDSAYTDPWDFATETVTSDMTLYAKWADEKAYALTSQFVTRFYELCLSRTPDATGLKSWTDALLQGKQTGAQVAYGFVFSKEFQAKNISNEEYVKILYKAFFNREPDKVGKDSWIQILNSGMSRYYVLHGFTNSTEFSNLCSQYSILSGSLTLTDPVDLYPDITKFVSRFYTYCLGRRPDKVGLADWVTQLRSGKQNGANIAYGFVFSTEFQSKNVSNEEFVKIMYRAFFDRDPDKDGFNNWLKMLNDGESRKTVLIGFVHSQEFSSLCQRYGIIRGSL